MDILTPLQVAILTAMAGKGAPPPWGAAVGASLEYLTGHGYTHLNGSTWSITALGLRAVNV